MFTIRPVVPDVLGPQGDENQDAAQQEDVNRLTEPHPAMSTIRVE